MSKFPNGIITSRLNNQKLVLSICPFPLSYLTNSSVGRVRVFVLCVRYSRSITLNLFKAGPFFLYRLAEGHTCPLPPRNFGICSLLLTKYDDIILLFPEAINVQFHGSQPPIKILRASHSSF